MTGRDIAFLRKQAEQGFSPHTANKVLDELERLRDALEIYAKGEENDRFTAIEALEDAP